MNEGQILTIVPLKPHGIADNITAQACMSLSLKNCFVTAFICFSAICLEGLCFINMFSQNAKYTGLKKL